MSESFYIYRDVDPKLVGVISGQIPCLFNGEDLVVCVQDLNDLVEIARSTLENNHEREAI